MTESIFVLRNNDIGDLLVVTPLFEALKRACPDHRVVAGVGPWSLDVLQGNPWVDEVVPVSAPWFNKYRVSGLVGRTAYLFSQEVRDLRRRRFEIGIDVLGSSWGALLLLRAGITRRLGTRGFAGGAWAMQQTVPFDPGLSVGRAAMRLAEILGAKDLPSSKPQIYLTDRERQAAADTWRALGPAAGNRLLLAPGAGLANRAWPESSWLELARRLVAMDSPVLWLSGTQPAEAKQARELARLGPVGAWAAVTPSLRQVFALVEGADLVICNSSMVLHVAAAFARPTLTLLGPSFRSAIEHDRTWGHPNATTLGPTDSRPGVASPGEALDEIRRLLSPSRAAG